MPEYGYCSIFLMSRLPIRPLIKEQQKLSVTYCDGNLQAGPVEVF